MGSSRRSYDRDRHGGNAGKPGGKQQRNYLVCERVSCKSVYGLRSVRDLRYHTFEDLALLVIEYDLEGSIEGLLKNNSNVRYSAGSGGNGRGKAAVFRYCRAALTGSLCSEGTGITGALR